MATSPIGGARPPVTYNDNPGYRAVSLDTLRLIERINRASREHGIPVSTFGRRALGDPRFFSDLMNGRSPRPATERKVARFIASLGEA